MSETLPWLNTDSVDFPPLDSALTEPNGLLAIGGDLSTKRLVCAYSKAIFPWFNQGEPPLWWSPSPRAIIPIDNLRINRTLRKQLNKKLYKVTINKAFEEVIINCADAPFRTEGTWILDEMKAAYQNLHQQGYAHSIEVWHNDELVGGLYGVAINGFFSGESMFYKKANASKIALVSLAQLLTSENIKFIDCQLTNPFLESMGCIEISRADFIPLQQQATNHLVSPEMWQPRCL